MPGPTKPGFSYNNSVIFEYPPNSFVQQSAANQPVANQAVSNHLGPAQNYSASQESVITTTGSYVPTMVPSFTSCTTQPFAVYSGPFYTGFSPCMHTSYISSQGTSPNNVAVPAPLYSSGSPPYLSPDPAQHESFKQRPRNVYQVDGNFDVMSPPNSIDSAASLNENLYQVDGNFDNISPPNSIDSAVSLEELYSFFESTMMNRQIILGDEEEKVMENHGQSHQEEAVKELGNCERDQIKQEILDDSKEIMIEKIVSNSF